MKRQLLLIFVVAALICCGSPALAKVELSGGICLEFSYGIYDEQASGVNDYVGLEYSALNGDTVLGVLWTSDDKKFQAYAEIGILSAQEGNAVETGPAYFDYNWEGGSLRFGQDDSVSDEVGPSQNLGLGTALEGFGNSVLDSNEKIRLTLNWKNHSFIFGIQAPYKEGVWEGGQTYHVLPGLVAAAELNFGQVMIHPWVHFENVRWKDGDQSENYNSYDLGLEICGDFGLVGFSVAASYGVNTCQNDPLVSGDPVLVNNTVADDASQIGLWGELRIGNLALGYGYATSRRDDWTENPYTQSAYACYNIEFGAITFTPELVWFDHGQNEAGQDQGNVVLFGLVCGLEF